MGKDKALLSYHGISQLEHLTNLLKPFCEQVFISAKKEVDYPNYPEITDQYPIESPLNGILSALTRYPKNAWLVIACDMPFIDTQSIKHLMGFRSLDKLATCYLNKESLIEPLFSIWEPYSYELLLKFQKSGELSPRKFLATNNVNIIKPKDYGVLTNVNSMEEYLKIRLSY